MTNKEWLDYLAQNAPDELAAWFDAKRVTNQAEMLHMPESHESATMQHIGQVIEDTVKRGVYGDTEPENEDSRERLEADAFAYLQTAYITYPQIIELLDRQAAITERKCRKPNWDYCETCETLSELTAERDNLADDLLIANKQREWYREKFSKCLDYADAIHALMDDKGLA